MLLGRRLLQGLGKISYSWYLWHWPVLILSPVIAPHFSFGWIRNLEMMILALWFAWLTYHLVESPVQKSRVKLRQWIPLALTLSLCSAGAALAVDTVASAELNTAAAVRYTADGLSDPFVGTATSGPVAPTVLVAAKDTPAYPAECISDLTTTQPADNCIILPDGSRTNVPTTERVVLLGDSHAGHWYDAIQAIAAENHWAVEILNKVGCPLPTVSIVNPTLKRIYAECDQWRAAALGKLAQEPQPHMIFVSSLYRYGVTNTEWTRGWFESLRRIELVGAPVVYLADTPYPGEDVPNCVATAFDNWSRCAFPRSKSILADPLLPTAKSPAYPMGLRAVVDINAYLCPAPGDTCPAVRDGTLLYRDESHVTRTAMKALTPVIRQQLIDARVLA